MIHALSEGRSALGNEDRFGYAAGAAWVLDGATDISRAQLEGRTAAWWLVEAYQAELQNRCPFGVSEIARTFLASLSSGVRDRLEARFPAAPAPVRKALEQASAALSLVRKTTDGWSVLCLADCPVLYRNPANGRVQAIVDPGFVRFEQRSLDALQDARARAPDADYDRLLEMIRPVLEQNRQVMNLEEGYAVGGIRPPHQALVSERDLPAGVTAFAIMSDGFSRWYDLFRLGTAEDLFVRIEKSDLGEVLTELRQAERRDPLGKLFPRFKQHDDATCLYVQAADL
ncbi:protein phosphatase 2C domain-containing protein [Qipengyuania sp.]|uniref:protein phosphatase 2C domain-containing protein n=1 Tax=Qipengyuania sp. TaxID=2004515 RepID=UPI003BAC2894